MTDVSWISIFFIWSNRQTRDSNSSSFKANWKKNSNKLVCFWDFFYRGNCSPHVFLGNEFGFVEAFCVYLLFLLSIKNFLVCNWWKNSFNPDFVSLFEKSSSLVNTIICYPLGILFFKIWNSASNIKWQIFPVPIVKK